MEIIEELKLKYNLQDDVILRLISLSEIIKLKRKKVLNYDELLKILKSVMNYDDMQIWLLMKQIEGIELTLNDELKKFFELKNNDEILNLYDVEQNCNQNNIDSIEKVLMKRMK